MVFGFVIVTIIVCRCFFLCFFATPDFKGKIFGFITFLFLSGFPLLSSLFECVYLVIVKKALTLDLSYVLS